MNEDEKQYISNNYTSVAWLRILGVLNVIGSIIGGIAVLATMGMIKTESYYTTTTTANPIGITLGITIIVQSLFLCVLFWGVAAAIENSAVTRYNLVEKLRTPEKVNPAPIQTGPLTQPSDIPG
jgi:hypothetical protein